MSMVYVMSVRECDPQFPWRLYRSWNYK